MKYSYSLIILLLFIFSCSSPKVPEPVRVEKKERLPEVNSDSHLAKSDKWAFAYHYSLIPQKNHNLDFLAETKNGDLTVGLESHNNIINLNRAVEKSSKDFEAKGFEVIAIKLTELDSLDAALLVAKQENVVIASFLVVKNNIGYFLSCGTPNEEDIENMFEKCFKISKSLILQ